jgi:NAD(P)-dependent dehydrogenase (short-subunit alcohol dehydrogenase family)
MTSAEMQELFNVNVFGVFKLMQYLLPLLRKQREGKILFVSSIRGVESHVYMGAYSASKAAIESMALDWAVTLAKWNIEVSVVQPGPLDTGIQLKAGSFFSNKDDPYAPYANFPVKCQSAEEAAKDIIEKIINGHLPFRFQTSKEAEGVVKKHLVDLSGNEWLNEQKRSIYE